MRELLQKFPPRGAAAGQFIYSPRPTAGFVEWVDRRQRRREQSPRPTALFLKIADYSVGQGNGVAGFWDDQARKGGGSVRDYPSDFCFAKITSPDKGRQVIAAKQRGFGSLCTGKFLKFTLFTR